MTGFANTTWPVKDISREENPKVPFSLLFAVVVISLYSTYGIAENQEIDDNSERFSENC